MRTWKCGTCDEEHDELPRNLGFGVPDEVFALDAETRAARVKLTGDTCVLDEKRWFVRAVLDIPTPNRVDESGSAHVSLGVWVEIPEADFAPITTFEGEESAPDHPTCRGLVANEVTGLDDVLGLEVEVRATSATVRPQVIVLSAEHALGGWQREGIEWDEWLSLLAKFSEKFASLVFHYNSERYDFDLEEPTETDCDDCGGKSTRLVRFVSFDEEALAIYYGQYSQNHDTKQLSLLLSIGDFSEGSEESSRRAFALEMRPNGTRVGDATNGSWNVPDLFGKALTREEALEHPLLEKVFEITDVARDKDDVIAAYLADDSDA